MPLSPEFVQYLADAGIAKEKFETSSMAEKTAVFNNFRALSAPGAGELAAVIKSLEEIKLSVKESLEGIKLSVNETTESLGEIKVSVTETKEDVKNLKQDNLPHISIPLPEMGKIAMKSLNDAKLRKKYGGEEGLPSIMSDEDIKAMASLGDEYESNCYVQCKLMSVCEEIGLSVVNSERTGFEWLSTLSGICKCDKRPDLIICNPCFYEARAQPNVGDKVLAVQKKLLGNDKTPLYGIKAGHPFICLDDIFIGEGKKDNLNDADVGQVKTYAGLQARLLTNSTFHRIVLFDRQKFMLFLSIRGKFTSATECGWNTPGSKQLMKNFFDVPSPLVKALKASCDALSVTPCTPQVNSPCILGAGGSGVVFRVTPTVTGLTDRRGTAVMQTKALKVVVGDSGAILRLEREWEAIKIAKLHSNRVVSAGAFFNGDEFSAYLMDEVGNAVDTSSVEQKKELFVALHDLHIHGIVHGDARVYNAIYFSGRIIWIDLASNSVVVRENSGLVADDFSLLFKSVFAQEPTKEQIAAYQQCVQTKRISAEAWVDLGLL